MSVYTEMIFVTWARCINVILNQSFKNGGHYHLPKMAAVLIFNNIGPKNIQGNSKWEEIIWL